MKLTTPQIIMMNHAAWVRQQRLDSRTKQRKESGTETLEDRINSDDDDGMSFEGKKIEELTTEQYIRYLKFA